MQAFQIDRYKTPIHAATVSEPTVGARDVLVRVHAAGVNQLDAKIADGEFTALLRYRTPLVLGHDVAGVIEQVGSAVTRFAVGDAVMARVRDHRIGTFAERIAVAEADLARKPTAVSMTEAASLPLVALTAWQALVERAHVRPGHRVLIHGGTGGFGSIAIQLARHLGAHVATTASGSNAEWLRSIGADEVIDYRTEDFAERLSDFDVVVDTVGGKNLERSLTVLRRGGTAVSIVGPPDPTFAAAAGLNPVLRTVIGVISAAIRRRARRLGVDYSFLFMRASGAQLSEIADLVDAGIIRPVVGRVFPFAETPAAVEAARRGGTRGKVVVSIVE